MSIAPPVQPLPAADGEIRAALADAHFPSLFAALAQITGDRSLLDTDAQSEDRFEVALDALRRFRDGGGFVAPAPAPADLRRMMEYAVGVEVGDDWLPLVTAELAIADDDPGAPTWHKDALAPDTDFRVAIVGAGMSGIAAAHRLQQAGVPFVIFEKNHDVGGTWLENTYPGCRVDVPNHVYSYSFAQRHDWPDFFSPQAVLLEYFRSCAKEFGVWEHIRFGTAVERAEFDDDTSSWTLRLRAADGGEESFAANAVISGVGQLNRPKLPDIPGRDAFAGPAFHTAQWRHDVDLRGKRVAVVGTGASGIQCIPVIAEDAAELVVFQRTPNWFIPSPDYHAPLPAGLRWLFEHVPHYCQWYRMVLFWFMAEGLLAAARTDPERAAEGKVGGVANDALRDWLTGYLEEQFADAPALRDHVVPTYPPLAKRPLLDNGSWAGALTRDNVRLVTEKITEITPRGIVTGNGEEHAVDAIVYATGFHASEFLTPMQVVGRGGVDLHEHWDGEARAYLGITLPGFPNFFCLYGPNTNIVANGSIIFFSESEVHYILGCIRRLFETGHAALDCRAEAHDAYNARIDDGNRNMVWGGSEVNSWYKNARGRVTQCWPFSLLEFWLLTREPDPADYELLGSL